MNLAKAGSLDSHLAPQRTASSFTPPTPRRIHRKMVET
jgi:hypothetical protein